ncbi:MAG: ABC transporter substrate-binding protein [Methanoregula sp.]|jgi:iron complex transport system substrate-binding protein|uniref:ABC transporter substrate-binding protein n=1 Tax=Methanoregula sp. TaxID=2052170 RepID=UPI0025CCC3C0|nr:ABC transporter substrate-binding protein [Methanoregula sp.]MCK9632380.1 ABC transporter substrate-binding protein [Methanoregula sp.]
MQKKWLLVFTIMVIGAILCAGCTQQVSQSEKTTAKQDTSTPGYKTVIDSRGVAVQVPASPQRVLAISDGLIEGMMVILGEEDKQVGVGSTCVQLSYKFNYPQSEGPNLSYQNGMNTVRYLNPRLADLTLVGQSGQAINYETVAGLKPDVIIMRLGDCTLRYPNDEKIPKSIETLNSLGIPLVIIKSPHFYDSPNMSGLSDEIKIIGSVFGKEERATQTAQYLEEQVNMIKSRTRDVPEDKKPTVLILGLSPTARQAGGAGVVYGTDTIESYFIEDIANAKNAYQENAYFKTISAEQILALNPDVIVLSTAYGYHPAEELYNAPYYQNLRELKAVKEKRVYSMPYTPCNCDRRLEYPLDVMVIARGAYPDRFSDINFGQWTLDFYKNLYGVDETVAKEIRESQWFSWTSNDSVQVSST